MNKFSALSNSLKRGLRVFFVLCAVIALADLVIHKHGDHWWNFFGFHSLYGFVACVALVLIAKGMRRFLMRGEDHYD